MKKVLFSVLAAGIMSIALPSSIFADDKPAEATTPSAQEMVTRYENLIQSYEQHGQACLAGNEPCDRCIPILQEINQLMRDVIIRHVREDPRVPSLLQRFQAMNHAMQTRIPETSCRGHRPPPPTRAQMLAAVREFALDNANDPRSVRVVGCADPEITEPTEQDCGRWHAVCSYRTRNAFGAWILETEDVLFENP